MTTKLPKLKGPGLITARPTTIQTADAKLSDYIVNWHNDLKFRQAKYASEHEAVCITPVGKDYLTEGLHLMARAAVQLGDDILALPSSPFVSLYNHKSGLENHWKTFTFADSRSLAQVLKDIGSKHLI